MQPIQNMSRLEFWGGLLAILGISVGLFATTVGLYIHSDSKNDAVLKEIQNIKIGQFTVEHKLQEVLTKKKSGQN